MQSHDQHGLDTSHASSSHEGDHGHGGTGTYIMVFLALCALTTVSIFTTLTWWREQVPDSVSWTIMMVVSCVKALLVILFFMHLLWEAKWKWVLTVPAACMSLFLVLMLIPDIGLRTRNYSEERWSAAAYPSPVKVSHAEHTGDADDTHGSHSPSHTIDDTQHQESPPRRESAH